MTTGKAATEVNFYHLTRSSLEDTLPRLLIKTLQVGERAVVLLGSPERVDALNTLLWTYDHNGFLPHGAARDGSADRQPVWLTHLDENPNGAGYLFIADHARSERVASYKRCFELFDGRDDAAVADARERWKIYKTAGHTMAYWQQADGGGWEKKA
ncbi:MAG: DNA polymerase III subunit chi [Reyranella sp.]|uniref:DNA polymerase III subunit chi n=1 Tax=Reyranella sp. TaxID=1929291 RepID=UPI002731995A|nr:DNA polymerase III subunit chi [Reyranella sp.]MDP1965067.1 DNA polymerase III subunit chi [Reyranella sp.]MDP2377461.1 DNA polymerase III subunit chi [Reyranella sp.]